MNSLLLLLAMSGFLCGTAMVITLRGRRMSPAVQLVTGQILLLVVFANAIHLIARKAGHWLDGQVLIAALLFVVSMVCFAAASVRRMAGSSPS